MKITLKSVLIVTMLLLIATCKKDEKTITVFEVTGLQVSNNSVSITGKITSLSGNNITDYGVCYSIRNTPSATDTALHLGVPEVGNFSATINNLQRNKTYYFKGFIKEADKYLYDDMRSAKIEALAATATTAAAGSVAESSATLNGSVNANGVSTAVSFEYGTTTAYGSEITASQSPVTGITATNVTASLTGLTSNTLYHYRVKAVNAAGTVNGEDMSFTTTMNLVAPAATTLAATSIANTTATINGSVNANGSNTTITFEYGLSSVYGSTINASPASASSVVPVSVSASLTGLTPGQLYHFRVKGVSAGGTTNGADLTFTTTQPPAATTSDATGITASTATLNGTVNAYGLSTNIFFEYGATVSYGTITAGNPATSSTSSSVTAKLDLTGLAENTTYHFRIKAVSDGGTTYGTDYSFTTGTTIPVPTVLTTPISSITTTSAAGGGNVTADGGAPVVERGICWSTSPNPAISDSKTTNGVGTGLYPCNLTGLTAGTLYYVRAFARNSSGTGYGSQISFTTLSSDPVVPILTTSAVTSITSSSATGGGNITSDGGSEVIYRGICYSISHNPTIDDSKTIDGSGTGSFSSPFTGINPSTTYYVRAYATNIAGTSYGNEVSFTSAAPDPVLPVVTTASISGITHNSASGGGDVISDGGATVTSRGICWSTSENPTITDSKTTNGTGTGSFISSLTSLNPSTIYYVRSYATNSVGTSYGNEVSFTTNDPPAGLPTLTTLAASAITSSTASTGGNITNDGGAAVTARGVCWGTSANPTTAGSKTADGAGSGFFTSSLSGLSYNTTYHIRAYATNSAGTAYGDDKSFTTPYPDPVLPTVTTSSASSMTHNSATGGGNVTADGYATVTERGICWSTTANPTTANTKLALGSGTGTFSGSMTGLTPSTTYHVRAYAINSVGTAYGSDLTFSTTAPPYVLATLTTTSATSITHNTASSGGNISNDGGAAITARGVCYGTSSGPTVSGTKTSDGTGSGAFTSSLAGLVASSTYYARAYATNAAGTAYGNEITFTTISPPPDLPSVTTTAVTGLGTITATSGGNVTYGGTSSVTARGVCWSTVINPTTSDSKTTDGTGTGSYSSSITGLAPCTTYHVRAYATNTSGTAYGEDILFTTGTVTSSVSTTSISAITSSTASSGGSVSGNCTSNISAKGVCWSTTTGPTVAGSKTVDGSGSGSYASSITGLSPCTLYYVRSYVTNSAGTSYGNEVSFTTSSVVSTVSTASITGISTTTATSGGTISGSCTSGITARGVCWSTSPGPTVGLATKTNDGTATGTYSSSIGGLTPCTLYYVRAYVTNAAGTSYGSEFSFTTGTALPTVTTTSISSITSISASSGGTLSGDCLSGITAKGVCWNTTGSPTTANSKTNNGSGSSSFSSSITGLTRVTTYYVRAYATNSAGTAYGNEVSFTTSAALPAISTTTPTVISAALTWAGGNMTDNGGATVSEMGVCYNTSGSPTYSDTKSIYGAGSGTFTTSISGLTAGTTYYMRAYAINSAGTNYGNQVSFAVPATISDYQGNVYKTVSISGQVWMQENLRATTYNDGSNLIQYSDTMSIGYGYYHTYNNNSAYEAAYAYMYNGFVVGGSKNICPVGWHIPTGTDWSTLANNSGGYSVAASKMNDLAQTLTRTLYGYIWVWSYWNSAMTGHDNSIAFYGRGGGYYLSSYTGLKATTMWWISDKRYVRIDYNSGVLQGVGTSLYGTDDNAFYIRCKKN